MNRSPLAVIVFILLTILSGCLTNNGGTVGQVPAIPAESGKYRIGPGDVLIVNVWGNSNLSLTVPVRPDGYISMPLIGDIRASDLEAEMLAESISEALSTQLRNPQVAVIISQVNSVQYISRVRVTGAVRTPTSLPFAREMSVLDAILEAGGINEVASANRAKLYRKVDGVLIEYDLRLNDILFRGLLETNYQMQPGDVITVPERLF